MRKIPSDWTVNAGAEYDISGGRATAHDQNALHSQIKMATNRRSKVYTMHIGPNVYRAIQIRAFCEIPSLFAGLWNSFV